MKTKPSLRRFLLLAAAAQFAGTSAHAADYYWDSDDTTPGFGNTNGIWGTDSFWSGSSAGTDSTANTTILATDGIIFGTATAAYSGTVTLNGNKTANSMTFGGSGAVSFLGDSAARTITLGSGGLTMASGAGAVTLGNGMAANDVLISLARGTQTWTNTSLSNLTFNNSAATFSRASGAALVFNQVGSGNFAVTSGVYNDATDIIGPWAFSGTGTSQRYATVSGGNIIGYASGTPAAGAENFTSATANYDFDGSGTNTLTASRTANTIRYTGTGHTISLGAFGSNSLTANGILAVGSSGNLTIQDTGSTGTLVVGSSNELVIAGSQNVAINTQITAGLGKSLTYAGTGTLTISASGGSSASTFTGSLNVNSGTFTNVTTQAQPNAIDVTTFVAAGATYNWQGAFGAGLSATKPWTVNGTLTKTGNGAVTFSSAAPISGTGTITFSGQADVTLNGDNSGFTGTINENQSPANALTLGNHGALGAGTFVFQGTHPVQSTVTNFLNPNVTALVFSSDRTFQGSNNMNLGTGAVTLNGGNRTLTVTGITLTLGGAVGQDVAGRQLTKAGTGTLRLDGALNYTGNTTLSAGNLVLTGTSSSYNSTVIINAGNLNLGGSTSNGSLGSTPTLTLAGGTFSYTRTGTNTQSFTITNFNSAPASVFTVSAGNTLYLGSIVRGAGVFYDFSTAGAGNVAANTLNNTGGIMSPYFTYGNSWAAANGPSVAISAPTYTFSSAAGTTGSNYNGNHIDVDNSAGTLDAGITTNSIRFSEAEANTMTLTGANVISTGGILVGSTVGSNLSTITGGTLTGPASGELVIQQKNTSGGLTIGSNIINNTATSLGKLGAGTLTLSGTNNTYTGTTTIYGGTLAVSGGAAIANAGLVTLANTAGVTFQLNSNETIGNLSGGGTTGGTVALGGNTLTLGDTSTDKSYAGTFTGSGTSSIIKQGTGTSTLSNANLNIPGTATVSAGMLAISSNSTVSGGTITLGANSSGLLFNGGASAGTSGLGGVTIRNNIVLGNSVTTTGARLWATGNQGRWNFTGGITGASGAASAQTLLFDSRAGTINGGDRTTTTISGVIANGNQALNLNFAITPQSANATNSHPAYVNLTGLNTFTGSITATRGAAGSTSWLVIGGERWSDGPNNTPTYGRMGSGRLANASGVYAGNFALGGTAGMHVNLGYFSSADQTWSGTIGTGGANINGALVKEGTGTLTLTGASTYNSLTTIGGGTLKLGFDTTTSNILPSGTPLNMGLGTTYQPGSAAMTISGGGGGGTLELAGASSAATYSQTVASLATAANTANRILLSVAAGSGTQTLTVTSPTLTIGAASGLNFNLVAGGANGSMIGTGRVVLTGNASVVTLNNGWTVLDAAGFGLAGTNASAQVIRNSAATTALPASGGTSPNNYLTTSSSGNSVTATQSAGSITTDTSGGNVTLSLSSGVTLSNNVWNFGGLNSNTAQVTGGTGVNAVASGNTIVINNFNAGTVTFNSPILAFGTNALVVGGTGTVVLNGLNTYIGNTTINSGTLQIGGRLVAGTYAGAIGINGGSVFQYSGSNAQTLSGVISGPGGITKDTNASVLTLSGTNTYTGPSIVNAGTLKAGAAAGGQAFGGGSAVTLADALGVTLDLNNFSQTIGSLSGGGTTGGNVTLGSNASLTTGGNNASTTFGGIISGTGTSGLTKNGIGTMTLTGGNTYAGATNVNAGTLHIDGNQSTATGAVTVASGAALSGTGTVGGATTIQGGGKHAAATVGAVGTQTFSGNLTYNNSSIFEWDVTNANTYDKVVGTAGALGGSDAVFTITTGTAYSNAFWDSPRQWTDIFSGFSGGNLASVFSSIAGTNITWNSGFSRGEVGTVGPGGTGGYFTISGSNLNWTAVPEPTSALAGLLLGAGLLRRRRNVG